MASPDPDDRLAIPPWLRRGSPEYFANHLPKPDATPAIVAPDNPPAAAGELQPVEIAILADRLRAADLQWRTSYAEQLRLLAGVGAILQEAKAAHRKPLEFYQWVEHTVGYKKAWTSRLVQLHSNWARIEPALVQPNPPTTLIDAIKLAKPPDRGRRPDYGDRRPDRKSPEAEILHSINALGSASTQVDSLAEVKDIFRWAHQASAHQLREVIEALQRLLAEREEAVAQLMTDDPAATGGSVPGS